MKPHFRRRFDGVATSTSEAVPHFQLVDYSQPDHVHATVASLDLNAASDVFKELLAKQMRRARANVTVDDELISKDQHKIPDHQSFLVCYGEDIYSHNKLLLSLIKPYFPNVLWANLVPPQPVVVFVAIDQLQRFRIEQNHQIKLNADRICEIIK